MSRILSAPLSVPMTPRSFNDSPMSLVSDSGRPRRKSILKHSTMFHCDDFDSDYTPGSSPDCIGRAAGRRVSMVRFSDECDEHNDILTRFDSNPTESRARNSPSPVKGSKRGTSPVKHVKTTQRRKEPLRSSLSGDDTSSIDSDDSANASTDTPVLYFSCTMSPEAQYAALRMYEDELYEKVHAIHPDIAEELEGHRTPEDGISASADCDCDTDKNFERVRDRLYSAMDFLNLKIKRSNKTSTRTLKVYYNSLKQTLHRLSLDNY